MFVLMLDKKLSIIIPAYNEENTIYKLVNKVLASIKKYKLNAEVIIIDDNSTDKTHAIVKALAQRNPTIKLIRHNINKGKAEALKTGFDYSNGDIIIIQDADLEYDPFDYFPLLLPILNGKSKVVYGNRFNNKLNNKLKKNLFYWGNKVLTWLTNIITGYKLHDMETCYKMFTKDVLDKLRPHLVAERFGIEPEITVLLSRFKENIVEVPIHYYPRTAKEGKKIKLKDFFDAVKTLFYTKIRKLS